MFHPWDETESNRSWSKAWINGFLDTGNVDYNWGQPPWSRWSSTWMASHPVVIHAWTLACQLCRSAPSMVTAHSTECDLPSSECVSYMDLAGHSLLPILFSQLWFRQSQRSQWNSFMESESKGASNVQKDSLQWTSDRLCRNNRYRELSKLSYQEVLDPLLFTLNLSLSDKLTDPLLSAQMATEKGAHSHLT